MAEPPIRVLVVEDNPEDYQILKVMFSKIRHRSYVPENVTTYQEAMERLRQHEHDAYLVDYKLGPDSGIDFLREAIEKEKCAAPIILLTGFGDHELDLEAMSLGAADFLNKNKLDPDILERSIRYALERKRAEENRARLAAVVETSDDAIYVLSEDGAVVSWNPGAERIYGYRPHEIGGKDISVMLTPGREEEFKRLIGTVRKGEAVANFTTAHQSKDGKSILVSMTLSPIRDKSGKVTRASVIARDITESEKAKATKEMLQTERDQLLERLQLQMERMPVACLLIDSHFHLTYWNPTAEKMFGYSFREVEGKHPKDIIGSSGAMNFIETTFKRLARGETTAQGEVSENRRKGGQAIFCEWYNTPLQDSDGNFTGIMSMVIDITERQKAAEVQSQLAAILQQTNDAVIGTDLDNRIFSWNRGAEIMLGYKLEDVLGEPFTKLVPEEHQDEMKKSREAVMKGESVSNYETVRTKKNGEPIDVSVTTSPIRDSKEKIIGISAITRDITDQKKSRESLKKHEEQLQLAEKMNAIGRLAGGVAHDFNNLLSVIGGNAEFLLSSLDKESPNRDEVGEIQKATRRGAELTKQLLVFGQKQISQPQPVNLNDLGAEMTKMLKRIIEAAIDLAIIQDKSLKPILADPGQMQQVILNLVLNAQDAMPKGGHLIVETKNISADHVVVEQKVSLPPGDYVRLSVTDTGTGMTPEIQKKIFEPFFTTKAGKGTGLGLASVYGIVTKWGGQIFVHSTPGMGSTFSIYFPALSSLEKAETKMKQSSLISMGSETILVAEDEAPVRKILVRTLEKYGYRVLNAMNGVEAVQVAWNYKDPIHLLLTDTVMPKMNGKELADELRKSRPKIKIIFVSGYPREVLSRQGSIDPAIHLIQKPFELEDLAHQVRKILDEK